VIFRANGEPYPIFAERPLKVGLGLVMYDYGSNIRVDYEF
jgi:hypothetical protein